MSTPSWYDVLDVEPDATSETIRGAWKSAITDLEPGNRRFRALNEAAEVLLDPEARAAHDADLARDAAEAGEDQPATTSPYAAPLTQEDATTRRRWHRRPKDAPVKHPEHPDSGPGWAPPVWLLAGVLVLVAVLVGLSGWQLRIPTDASVQAATRSAQASAERAAVAVLSYDYQNLDASEATASSYLTPKYRRTDYAPLFEVIKANAPSTKTVVTAEVVASGIVRSGEDRVSVLVFVNRPTLNASTSEPVVYRDQVTMEMTDVGGEWLVDGMVTTPVEQ